MPVEHDHIQSAEGHEAAAGPLEFALVRFDGPHVAAASFARACERCGGVPWMHEVGVVERYRDGHLVLCGSFGGHYVHFDESDHASERGAQRDTLLGGLLRGLLGAPGRAVELVLGGAIASPAAAPGRPSAEALALTDALRARFAPSSSALAIVAERLLIADLLEGIGAAKQSVERHLLAARAGYPLGASTGSGAPPATVAA